MRQQRLPKQFNVEAIAKIANFKIKEKKFHFNFQNFENTILIIEVS